MVVQRPLIRAFHYRIEFYPSKSIRRQPRAHQIIEKERKFFIVVRFIIPADTDADKITGFMNIMNDGMKTSGTGLEWSIAIMDFSRAVDGYLDVFKTERGQFFGHAPCKKRAVGNDGKTVGSPLLSIKDWMAREMETIRPVLREVLLRKNRREARFYSP